MSLLHLEIVVVVLVVVVVFVLVVVIVVILVVIVVLIVVLAVLAVLVVVIVVLIVIRHFKFLQWVISYGNSMSKTHKNHSTFRQYFGTIFYCFFVTLVL